MSVEYRYTIEPTIQGCAGGTVTLGTRERPCLWEEAFPTFGAARQYVEGQFTERGLTLEWTPCSDSDPNYLSSPWFAQ